MPCQILLVLLVRGSLLLFSFLLAWSMLAIYLEDEVLKILTHGCFLWLPPLLRRLNRRCDERYSPTYFRLNHWRQGAKSFKPDWPLIGLKVRPPSHHPGSAGADLLSLGDASSSMSPKSFYLRIFFTLDKAHQSTSIWCLLIWLNSSF